MLELGLKFTAAYLLGSVLGSLVIGQLFGGVDIRKHGSGNAGSTNALRTQGRAFALWVLLIDITKGVAAVVLLPGLALFGSGLDAEVSRELVLYSVAFAVILGHVYPLWYGFKGGKGGATAAGVLCALAPPAGIAIVIVWLIVVFVSGYVGLATMAAAIAAAVYVATMALPEQVGLFAFTVVTAALIVYTHRGNIQRMRHGTEVRMGPLHRGR